MLRRSLLLILTLFWTGIPGWAEERPSLGWLTQLELNEHRKLISLITEGAELAPFTTDGCSGGMSWVWSRAVRSFPDLGSLNGQRPEWEMCCVTHDVAYHDASGTTRANDSYFARLRADQDLRICIREIGTQSNAGEPTPKGDLRALYERLSDAMFWAVRFGGEPCSGLAWRWGYGFADC